MRELGVWKKLHNPKFKQVEFDLFKSEAGLHAFTLSPTKWIEGVDAIGIDFSELLEIIKLLKIDSNNINQIAKVANSCGTVDGKTISDMKENHERVLKKVEKTFNKYLDIY